MSKEPTKRLSIPILSLKEQYQEIGASLEAKVIEVLRSGNYILGRYVKELEEAVANLCHTQFACGVANGTDALTLALWAADIGPQDEVITSPFTFAATVEAIVLRGAKPVFVDIDASSFNIDVSRIQKAITTNTKAIMPVHLYGQAAQMDTILALAQHYKLKVIEDNAQAIGATYKGQSTGSFGDLSCFSFYPTKNLGAAGDAGMILTNNEKLAERLFALRAHGMKTRYYHDELGVNSRLDEIQAAILLTKLPYLSDWNTQRNTVAQWYQEYLNKIPGLILPSVSPDNTHVWHQYTVRVSSSDTLLRDKLALALSNQGIGSMCYYPVPLHRQKAFAQYGWQQGDYPVAEKVANQVLSLPMYPELSQENVKYIASVINQFMQEQPGMFADSPLASYSSLTT